MFLAVVLLSSVEARRSLPPIVILWAKATTQSQRLTDEPCGQVLKAPDCCVARHSFGMTKLRSSRLASGALSTCDSHKHF